MDTDLLSLSQWLSPAFPLGGFAYSHGLEAAVADGLVADAASLRGWVGDVLTHGAGRTDAILLAQAHKGPTSPLELQALARALAASRERWIETRDQGAAFIQTTNAILNRDAPNLVLPVAVGFVARQLSLETGTVAALYLNAFATTLVLAGVRFIPLGQTEGQAVLQDLHPLIAEVAVFAVDADVDDIETSTFGADLSAMGHETQEVRIFRT